jgi:hypothetical protein
LYNSFGMFHGAPYLTDVALTGATD